MEYPYLVRVGDRLYIHLTKHPISIDDASTFSLKRKAWESIHCSVRATDLNDDINSAFYANPDLRRSL